MSAFYNTGFTIREASWHQLEQVIQEDLILPADRPRAYRLAGHDYKVIERPNGNVGRVVDPETYKGNLVRVDGEWRSFDLRAEKKGLYINHERSDGSLGDLHGNFIEVANATYGLIPNEIGWDLLEALFEQGLKLDTGFVLHDGAVCVVTAYLPEPVQITGDDSRVFPFVSSSWGHDGSRGLNVRSTWVREVCANTEHLSELEASKAGTQFTFRHTKNWKEHVEAAKKVIAGLGGERQDYVDACEALAAMPITVEDRERFAMAVALDQRLASVPKFKADVAAGVYSPRVQKNAEKARDSVLALFNGPTVPEAHKLTGYGLMLAGGEYFDHIREYQKPETYVGRTLLRDEPSKARLPKLIRDLVEA